MNQNEKENKNAIGGTCARGAKRPRVGRFTSCFFVVALTYVELYIFSIENIGFDVENVVSKKIF